MRHSTISLLAIPSIFSPHFYTACRKSSSDVRYDPNREKTDLDIKKMKAAEEKRHRKNLIKLRLNNK